MTLLDFTIPAHKDFEFCSTLERSIDCSIQVPEGEVNGLVVYIPGFGGDSGSYRQNFQNYITETYNMACLIADYHCFYSRPTIGAGISIDNHIMRLLRSITGCVNQESVDEVLLKLNEIKANHAVPLRIPGTIYPKKNEYQNFGILPALDHIYAINHVFKKFTNIPKRIYAIGSSYGGYIANIISKLAPCTLNAVFDNSSWASPNLQYVIGREIGRPEFTMMHSKNIVLDLNVLSPWSNIMAMPNSFNNDRIMIRSFPKSHIKLMGKTGGQKTIYRFVHAENDFIANTGQKQSFADLLRHEGFDVQMRIYSKADVDGRYIKNVDHGMGLSMRTFFSNQYRAIKDHLKDDQRIDQDFEHAISFDCDTLKYEIEYSSDSQPVCRILV